MYNEILSDVFYKVVVNTEEQYSIWALNRTNPYGWEDAGFKGERDDCLKYIATVWSDMRPRSIRE